MDHLCLRHIGHRVTCIHGRCRVDHVFIKKCAVHKPLQLPENVLAVRTADIGSKVRLDPHGFQIFFRLDHGLIRVVKGAGITLDRAAVLCRKLPCVSHRHGLTLRSLLFQPPQQVLDQMLILGDCIIRHEYHDIRFGIPRRQITCTAMIKLFLRQMMDLHTGDIPVSVRVPVRFFCIHNDDPVRYHRLLPEHLKQSRKPPVRLVHRNQNINCHDAPPVFLFVSQTRHRPQSLLPSRSSK